MTTLLERAVLAASHLPEQEQDALAARILEEIEDEQAWNRTFDATTDAQWDALAAMARSQIAAEGSKSLDALIARKRV